jgi:hypothetical protein
VYVAAAKALATTMTRDQQIRKALELLAPPPAEREECKHEIRLALDMVKNNAEVARSFRAFGSKQKGGLERYCAALRRLTNALGSLDPTIRPWFSFADPNYDAGQMIEEEIKKVTEFLNRPSVAPSRNACWNKAAVAAAYICSLGDNRKRPSRGGENGKSSPKYSQEIRTSTSLITYASFEKAPV